MRRNQEQLTSTVRINTFGETEIRKMDGEWVKSNCRAARFARVYGAAFTIIFHKECANDRNLTRAFDVAEKRATEIAKRVVARMGR